MIDTILHELCKHNCKLLKQFFNALLVSSVSIDGIFIMTNIRLVKRIYFNVRKRYIGFLANFENLRLK